MSRVMKVALVAGQECLLSTHGIVRLLLLDGVVEVAGTLLQPNVEISVSLSAASNRRIAAYSFEGGTFSVTSSGTVDVVKYSTEAGALMAFTRSTLTPLRASRVAVIGAAGAGKTLAAQSICNMLARGAAGGSATGGSSGVFLVDLSQATNSVLAPGCISGVRVSSAHPLMVGNSAAPEEVGVSFFCGSTRPVKSVPLFLHQVVQLQECVQALVKQSVSQRDPTHIVYDLAAPDDSVPIDAFLRRTLEVIRPTHVVVIANKKGDNAAGRLAGTTTWYANLQEDVQRLFQDCEFRLIQHVPHHVIAAGGNSAAAAPSVSDSSLEQQQQLLLEEYFSGTAGVPLGTTKVVFKLSALRFYTLIAPATATAPPTVQRITPTESDVSLTVCAVSHASVEAEIPFANICGLMLVVSVDQAHDELTAIVPSGECEVPRPFILVPDAGSGKMKVTPPIVASYS